MKQLIRENTFETNSSSMHSLVVTKSCRQYTNYELNFGHEPEDKDYKLFDICYDDPQFERFPFQVLRTPREKLMYYIGWYIGGKKDKDKEQMVLKFLSDKLNLPIKNINIKLSDNNWIDEETYSYPKVYPKKQTQQTLATQKMLHRPGAAHSQSSPLFANFQPHSNEMHPPDKIPPLLCG